MATKTLIIGKLWIKEEVKGEINKYFEMDDNEDTVFQKVWNAAKQLEEST